MSLQPKPSEIPEFRDVEQLLDGSWRAVHRPSGEVIAAATFYQLEQIEAPGVRIAYTLGLRGMSTPLCLGCGQEVRLNKDRKWETWDGDTTCTGGGPHRVEQVVPDPPSSHTQPRTKAGGLS